MELRINTYNVLMFIHLTERTLYAYCYSQYPFEHIPLFADFVQYIIVKQSFQ